MVKKKNNIPSLRFSEFESAWEEKFLGDLIISIQNGLSLDQNYENKGYKVTRIETISNHDIDIEKVGYVDTHQDISEYKLEIGDMLFSNINSVAQIGKIVHVNKEYDLYHGMNLLRIKINKILNHPKYIYYLLSNRKQKQYFEMICNKAVNQASINQTDLKKTRLTLPSLPEQQKIASFLSSVDERIQQLTRKKNLLEQYKKGIMQKIFSREIRFKDDKGKDFSEWDNNKLGNLTDIKTGKKDLINKVDGAAYPFFVRSDKIERIDSFSYDGEAILIPGDGKIGEIFHYINGKFDYHQRVYKISDGKDIYMKYLFYYLSLFFYKHAMSFTVKATVDSLRLPIIQSFNILLPIFEEQQKIASFLSSIDKKIELVNTQLEKTKEWKKGLLQKMFV